jgi:hypothetical protein
MAAQLKYSSMPTDSDGTFPSITDIPQRQIEFDGFLLVWLGNEEELEE